MLSDLAVAVVGGLVGASAAVVVQYMQVRAAARERREERIVAAVQDFATCAMEWSNWLRAGYGNRRLAPAKVLDENNVRTRNRSKAYRNLQLHCSGEMLKWLQSVYGPAEDAVKRLVGQPLRDALVEMNTADDRRAKEIQDGLELHAEGGEALRRYENLLGGELVEKCRAEMKSLS